MNTFSKRRYEIVRDVLSAESCSLLETSCLIKKKYHDPIADRLVPKSDSFYGDTLVESLLTVLQPVIESHTGLNLCPTYSYFRVYRAGDQLPRHADRQPCEISSTVCLGIKTEFPDYSDGWDIFLDPESNHDPDIEFVSREKAGTAVKLNVGDLLIYRGCELEHWREPLVAGEGDYIVQAFLHYLDRSGKYFPNFAFDSRPGIGAPLSLKRQPMARSNLEYVRDTAFIKRFNIASPGATEVNLQGNTFDGRVYSLSPFNMLEEVCRFDVESTAATLTIRLSAEDIGELGDEKYLYIVSIANSNNVGTLVEGEFSQLK